MHPISTLLVDIEHPDLPDPLRLMCGQDFSVLRTDTTGKEIYGYAHNGKEYLLTPFSFEAVAQDKLSVRIPPSYMEWFLDMRLHDARIRFSTPQGEAVFSKLSAEYASESGRLHIDEQERIHIIMDKADPAAKTAARTSGEASSQSSADGRNHSVHAALQAQSHAGHSTCACGCGGEHEHEHTVQRRLVMTDQELAGCIRKRIEGLNLLLEQAALAGLELELAITTGSAASAKDKAFPQLELTRIARLL